MSYYREEKRSRGAIIAVAVVAVAILLAVSVYLLLDRDIDKESSSVGGNVITTAPTDLIGLADKNEAGDVRFAVGNMFPGDRESEHVYIGIKDDGVKALCFGVHIAEQTKNLSEVMGITVSADGVLLYDGTVKEMPQFLRVEFAGDVNEVDYEIALYLDTSVGNEYQSASLTLDFDWWVASADYVQTPDASDPDQTPPDGTQPDGTTPPDGNTENKKPTITVDLTGDGNGCVPWCVGICPWCVALPVAGLAGIGLLVGAGFGIAAIAKKRRRKAEEKAHRKLMRALEPESETVKSGKSAETKKAKKLVAKKASAKSQGPSYGTAALFGLLSIGASAILASAMKSAHKPKKPKNNNPPKKKK